MKITAPAYLHAQLDMPAVEIPTTQQIWKDLYPEHFLLHIYDTTMQGFQNPGTYKMFHGPVIDFTKHGENIVDIALGMTVTSWRERIPLAKRLTTIIGADKLVSLTSAGTEAALRFEHQNLSAEVLNQFFADLPPADGVLLALYNNPGSATCDATIATSKGYFVDK